MPPAYPDFPHHTHIARTSTPTSTTSASATGSRSARASSAPRRRRRRLARSRSTRRDRALRRAARRQRPPLGRALARAGVPGRRVFAGVQIHSHEYLGDDPDFFRDKPRRRARDGQLGDGHRGRGELLGAAHLPRRPPRRLRDPEVPVRPAARPVRRASPQIPFAVRRRFDRRRCCSVAVGDMERYGLPKPDHRFGDAHPTISDDVLSRIAHGEIEPRPNIARLTERTVVFADGSEVEADVVVYCTGYKVTFPFFDEDLIAAPGQRPAAVPARLPPRPSATCSSSACCSRSGAIMPLAAGPVGVGRRPPRGPLRAARAARRCAPTWPRARADVQALRRLQAPHDAGRLRRLPGRRSPRSAGAAPRGRRAHGLPVPPRAVAAA